MELVFSCEPSIIVSWLLYFGLLICLLVSGWNFWTLTKIGKFLKSYEEDLPKNKDL